ncbi:hypothetical protein LCGC14_0446600 [marine sediment metagenome]|uniref:IstB-like ATP-binding domain-containing protein n=1 Tax=marine sediment metagenome TaxID=412755 RepID=A0A0F9SPJ9_9ZZZZ
MRPKATRQHFEQFLKDCEAGGAPHLLLTGRPGVGKSHLSVAAYRWMVRRVGTVQALWLNVPDFCDKVKASYGDNTYNPMQDYEEARRLVVLDDLFGRVLTTHEGQQIVYRLIDIAYQNGAGMLITMNQSPQELTAALPPHELSRVLAGASIVPMEAEQDWRRR